MEEKKPHKIKKLWPNLALDLLANRFSHIYLQIMIKTPYLYETITHFLVNACQQEGEKLKIISFKLIKCWYLLVSMIINWKNKTFKIPFSTIVWHIIYQIEKIIDNESNIVFLKKKNHSLKNWNNDVHWIEKPSLQILYHS